MRVLHIAAIAIVGAVVSGARPVMGAPLARMQYQVDATNDVWLIGPGGEKLAQLLPSVEASYRTTQGYIVTARVQPSVIGVDRVGGNGWRLRARARVGSADFELRLEGARDAPHLTLAVEIAYGADVQVVQELLRFRAGPVDQAQLLDRAYRLQTISSGSYFMDAITPHRAWLHMGKAELTLASTTGVQGVWARRLVDRQLEFVLEIDHPANHPLVRQLECRAKYVKGLSVTSGWRNLSRRRAGETWRSRMEWIVGPNRLPEPMRYPEGRRAAIVLVDHADQSDADKLEALAFGATGAVASGRVGAGYPGLVNRGLRYSKSIFVAHVPPYAAHFDSLPYRRLLERMVAAGVEVGLHSLTGVADDPIQAAPLFATFRRVFNGRTWIDHQPDTNCEAVTSRGSDPTSRWYMLPLLQAHGFRYLWNGIDAPLPSQTLNMLRPAQPALRTAILYAAPQLELAGERPFVLFSSAWLYHQRAWLLAHLIPQRLDTLEAEHGLLVGHVYLDTYRPHSRFRGRELLDQASPSSSAPHYVLRPEVDQLFQQLGRRQIDHRLWVVGIEALGDHLLSAMRVRLRPAVAGVQLSCDDCTAGAKMTGLTLRFPRSVARVTLDGLRPAQRQAEDGLWVWFDLIRGQPRMLTLYDAHGAPLAPISSAGVSLKAPSP